MVREKRKYPRMELERPVKIRAKGKNVPAATLNLSRGGVCLLTDYNESIERGNAEVVVNWTPEIPPILLSGTILRQEKGIAQKVAIQFTKKQSKDYKDLEHFLLRYDK